MLAAYLALFPILRPGLPHMRDAMIAFFYLSDYAVAFWNEPDYLRHTWSLAVEEHFYVLWPLVMLRFRPTVRALVVAYIIATAWRWGWNGWHEAYSRFDTRMSGLILGCFIARVSIHQTFPAWPGLLVLGAATATYSWGEPWIQGWGFLLVEIAAAIAILGTPPRWLSHSQLVYLGQLSYGVYLWHYPIVKLMRDAGLPWEVMFPISLSTSVLLAAASFHWFEVYFRSPPDAKGSVVQAKP